MLRNAETVNDVKLLRLFCKNVQGTTVIEYSLIAASIALIIVINLGTIGTRLNHYFSQIAAVN